jgi:pilus assembly protein CpaB
MRALSVPIKDKNVAGGFILPNDRVDVIVTRRVQGSNGTQQVGETLLHNIRVLAVGKMIDQKGDDKTASGKTATLELDPKQVEIVSMANAMGEISLSLRSLADSGSQTSNGGGRGGTVKMLKFGIPSQAFGVN